MWEETTLPDTAWISLYEGSNPVVPLGNAAASDKFIRELGNVLYEPGDTGKEYKFFYTGYNVAKSGAGADEKVHYAYSSDGISWTKSASNPIISQRSEDPYCVKSGSTYYLFVEDKPTGEANIKRFHATNPEGPWTDDGLITGITNCQSPVVWIEGATWYMLYEQYPITPQDIRLAASNDGLAWTAEASNPVMDPTDTNWVLNPTQAIVPDDVIKIGNTYYMFYHAHTSGWKAGMATSTDLLTWTDAVTSPIRATDELGTRDIEVLMVYHNGEKYVFMYTQNDTDGVYRGYPSRLP